MKIILERSGHDQKWLASQWGVSQPSISKKFQSNNWKESDLKIFCKIMNVKYEVTFIDKDNNII